MKFKKTDTYLYFFNPKASVSATTYIFQILSPYVQACISDILKVFLRSIYNIRESDGSLRNEGKVCCYTSCNDMGKYENLKIMLFKKCKFCMSSRFNII